MTCGKSRFVFTVINALCNSLKTIKEADVFFFSPSYTSSVALAAHYAFPLQERRMSKHTVHTQYVFRYSAAAWTVVGISGRQFTQ